MTNSKSEPLANEERLREDQTDLGKLVSDDYIRRCGRVVMYLGLRGERGGGDSGGDGGCGM